MDIKNANSHPIKVAKVDSSYDGPYANSHPFKVQDVGGGGGGDVSSVNGKTGDVVLDATDVGAATTVDIDARVKTNAGAPTTATVGTVGQLLEDTVNGELYQCTEIVSSIGVDSDAGLTSRIANVTFPITNLATLNAKISAVPSLVSGNTYMVRSMSGGGFYVSTVDDTARLGVLTGVVAYQFPATLGVTPTPPAAWSQQIGRLTNTQPIFSFQTVSTGQPSYVWEKVGDVSDFVGTNGQTDGVHGLVPAPTTADIDKFLKSDGTWATAGGGGGSAFTTLTSADYNWPESGTKTAVALWKLDPGIYYVDNSQSLTTKVIVYSSDFSAYYNEALFFVYDRPQGHGSVLIEGHGNFGNRDSNGSEGLRSYIVNKDNGQLIGLYAAATHDEVIDAGISPVYPWSPEWPTNNPDGMAVFMRSGQFNFPYKTKLYLTGTYAVDNFIGRVEINQFENDNNVSVFGFKATDLNHGTIYLGQTQSDGTSEFLYTVSTTTVQTSGGNSGSSSSEPDPGSAEQTVTCPFCGMQTPADSTVCQFCGNDISGGSVPDPGEEPGPEMPSDPGSEEPTTTCPNCLQQIPESSTVCPLCGYDMTGGSMVDPGGEIAPEEPSPEEPAAPEDAEAPVEG